MTAQETGVVQQGVVDHGRGQVAVRDADRLKTERPAPLLDLRRQRRAVHAIAS